MSAKDWADTEAARVTRQVFTSSELTEMREDTAQALRAAEARGREDGAELARACIATHVSSWQGSPTLGDAVRALPTELLIRSRGPAPEKLTEPSSLAFEGAALLAERGPAPDNVLAHVPPFHDAHTGEQRPGLTVTGPIVAAGAIPPGRVIYTGETKPTPEMLAKAMEKPADPVREAAKALVTGWGPLGLSASLKGLRHDGYDQLADEIEALAKALETES